MIIAPKYRMGYSPGTIWYPREHTNSCLIYSWSSLQIWYYRFWSTHTAKCTEPCEGITKCVTFTCGRSHTRDLIAFEPLIDLTARIGQATFLVFRWFLSGLLGQAFYLTFQIAFLSWKTQNGGRTCGLKWLQRRRRRWRRKAWVTWKRWHRKGYWWVDNLISLGFRLIHCCTLNK